MADNTEEGPLIDPTKAQSDNRPNETIPNQDIETINPNQETENMEAHYHGHHEGKRNWKSYFWEFLMLFLAVFCGFLAEYQLEHKIERDREKDYIHSMINDLKTDTSKLSKIIATYQQLVLKQDTLLMTFSSLNNGFKVKYYRNMGGIGGYSDFIYTDATIQQLKNSGGFRILRTRNDIDSIMAYDGIVKGVLSNEAIVNRNFLLISDLTNETFNFQYIFEQIQQGKSLEKFKKENFDFLLTHDKNKLAKYYNHLLTYSRICNLTMNNMKSVKIEAIRLLSYLEKKYNFQ